MSITKENKKTVVDLTNGSIVKGMIAFAIPVFLGQLLQQFYKILSEYDDSYINASFKCEYLDFQGNKGAANSRASSRIAYYDF